jgi:Fur family ferric uptake transcriptional regulator
MEKPDFKAQLKDAGFKATPRRIELLELLWKEKEPLAVGMLAAKLKGEMNEVTLYRALEVFADAGLIRRVDLGHGHGHYEMEKKHHHHVVCTDCGTIEDVTVCPLPALEKSSRRFKSIYSHNVEFFGLCKECS